MSVSDRPGPGGIAARADFVTPASIDAHFGGIPIGPCRRSQPSMTGG